MSDTNHRTSVFLGLKDNLSPGLRRITGEVNRTASAFAQLASRAGGGIGGGLTAGLRGIAGVAGLATRGLLGLAKTAGGIVVGGLRAAANVARTTISVFTGLVRTGAALAATLAGLTAAGIFKGIQAGGGREAQFKSLVNIEKGAARAAKSMADLKRIARQPGIGFDEAIQGYSGLRAVRAPSGLAKGLIGELGNAVALNSGGLEQLQQVLRGVQQTFGKGKISAEELNQQILEPAPMLRQAIEAAFGTADSEKLTKLLEQRGLSVAQFWERVLVKMRQLPRAGDGAKNALENVSIAAKELTITFGQGFLGADGAKRISALGGWLESLDPIAKRLGQNLRRIFDRVSDKAGRMASEFKLAWRALKAGDTEGLSRMPQWAALLAENVQKGANWLREMGARAQSAGQYVGKFVGDFATAWRSMHGGLVDTDLLQGLDRNAVGAARGLSNIVDRVKSLWSDLRSGDWGSFGEGIGQGLAQLTKLATPFAVGLAKSMAEAGIQAMKGFILGLRQEFPKLDEFMKKIEKAWEEWGPRLANLGKALGKLIDDHLPGVVKLAEKLLTIAEILSGSHKWTPEEIDVKGAQAEGNSKAEREMYRRVMKDPDLSPEEKRRRLEVMGIDADQVRQDERRRRYPSIDATRPAYVGDDPARGSKFKQRQQPMAFGGQRVPIAFRDEQPMPLPTRQSSWGGVYTLNVQVTTDHEPSKQDVDKFNRHIRDWVREVNG